MSQVSVKKIQLGQSGTASNNLTLTVPDAPNGTLKIARGNVGAETQDILEVQADGYLKHLGLPAYQCRAWVNFNGIGIVSIRASGNVSSITDNGVGVYTVNFTSAMPDTNYSIASSCRDDGATAVFTVLSNAPGLNSKTTPSFQVATARRDNGSQQDVTEFNVMVFR